MPRFVPGLILSTVFICNGIGSPAAAQTAAALNPVLAWNDATLKAIKDVHIRSTVAARALAMVQTAEYDAWAEYDPHALPTELPAALRRPAAEETEANKAEAVSYAAYRTLLDLFPTEQPKLDALLQRLGYDPANATLDPKSPAGIGNAAAAAVLAYRHHDGSNQLGDLHPGPYSDYTGYVPPNEPDAIKDPNGWQPLRVTAANGTSTVQEFLTPFWYKVTPFALTSGDEFRPKAPVIASEAEAYRAQADRVLALSAQLDERQKALAEYFDLAGGESSAGQWNRFAQFVAERDHHTLDDDVKLFFALDNAELDAGIAVWDAKIHYDSVRPITAIHYLYHGKPVTAWAGPDQGARKIDGGDWRPYLETPPFAEYYSAHSGFAAAAAEVLRRFTGSDEFGFIATWPAGASRIEKGPAGEVVFTFATFSQTVDDEGASREYGGLHFHEAIVTATGLGQKVGDAVWNKAQHYIEATKE